MADGYFNELVREIRKTRPRSWLINNSGGVLTHAKVANLERGRVPTEAEVQAISKLADLNQTVLSKTTVPLVPQPQTPVQPPPAITPVVDTAKLVVSWPVEHIVTPIEQAMDEWAKEDGPVSLKAMYEDLFERQGLEPPTPQLIEEPPPPAVAMGDLPPVPVMPPVVAQPIRIEFDAPPEAQVGSYHTNYVQVSEPPNHASVRAIDISIDFNKISPTQLSVLDGIPRFSNSTVQTAKRCKRKWWLTYYRMLQLRKKDQLVGVRSIGDRVHRALQLSYSADPVNRVDARIALDQAIDDDWTAIVTQYNNDVPPEMKTLYEKQNDLERAMIEGYVEWLGETGADSELEIIAPEAYLEAMLPELSVMIMGRLDVRVRRIYDGVRLFMDHKTVGDFGVVKTLPMDEQMLMYILLEELQHDTNPRVAGALYNMLRRVKRTASAKPPFYHRVEVRHSPIEIASFRRRLVSTLDNILFMTGALNDGAHHLDVAPPTPTKNCVWDCQFFGICNMLDDGSRAEDAIFALYEVADPYSYYAKGKSEGEVTE